jgi:hypothetical protein
MQVLAKLTAAGSATHNLTTLLADSLRSATLSGGSVADTARSADKFAGGVHGAAAKPVVSTLSDTVVAGSGFAGKIESAHHESGVVPAHALAHADTINVAGVTASAVKTEPSHAPKVVGQTITLSDKTMITVSGVSAHDVTKAH